MGNFYEKNPEGATFYVQRLMSCLRVFLNTISIQKKISDNLKPGQLRFRAVLSDFYFPQFVKIPTLSFMIHSDLHLYLTKHLN